MVRSTTFKRRRRAHLVVLAALALVWALPAQAAPFTAYFTGNSTSGDPTTNYGMSAADAFEARDDFGIPILDDLAFVGEVTGSLSVNQSLQSVSQLDPPDTDVATAHSIWTVNNLLGQDLHGATFLLFTHTDPYSTGDGVSIDYADANVGLVIDADQGWFIVKATEPGEGDFYYAAVLLDRSAGIPAAGVLPADSPSSPFDVHYVLRNEGFVDSPDLSEDWQLPEFQLGMGYDPNLVPEPGTAALLSMGLALLGLGRRRS